jgi:hypothetical protein
VGKQTIYDFYHVACVTAVYCVPTPIIIVKDTALDLQYTVAETKDCAFRVVPQDASGQRHVAIQINQSATLRRKVGHEY